MLCTGYLYDFPIIPKLCIKEGRRVCNLWEQIFWISDQTLSSVGFQKKDAIFLIAEAQSAYIVQILSRRLGLPYDPTMRKQKVEGSDRCISGAKAAAEQVAAAKNFHDFVSPKDKEYIERLSYESRDAD